jgi:hypothetical protein
MPPAFIPVPSTPSARGLWLLALREDKGLGREGREQPLEQLLRGHAHMWGQLENPLGNPLIHHLPIDIPCQLYVLEMSKT